MQRKINKVAVLGSGVMGSRIACHFANIGLSVVLLDIVTPGLSDTDKLITSQRNTMVNTALLNAVKSSPAPIYKKELVSNITTGNFEDDMYHITECDWIIEVVIENLEIKKGLFQQVEKFRTSGTLISSNTSGISINSMLSERSEDFCAHFCGTHFFNPPRYLKLFEIIPSLKTTQEVIAFYQYYAPLYLGKTAVLCKDTPAFIANRVGVFSMMTVFHLMIEMNLEIDEIDALTGTLIGRPKSASFRTGDIVGLDTLVKVAHGVYEHVPTDEQRAYFAIPEFIEFMVSQKWLGDKTGQGFYKLEKKNGKKEILVLDWKNKNYKAQQKYTSTTLSTKSIDSLNTRLKKIYHTNDIHGQFLKKLQLLIFAYVSHRIPEISDTIKLIDDAMKAGFGWELGPFENWDIIGVKEIIQSMKENQISYAPWVDEMLAEGNNSFYKIEQGNVICYDISLKKYATSIEKIKTIILNNVRADKTVWKNSGCSILDIGDDVLCVEFQTKLNAIGGEVIEGINKAIDMATDQYRGIVLGNNAPHFSAGANLAMIFMLAIEQEYEELSMIIRQFQNTVMRLRHASIPIVAAPHGLTLGGGCEIVMHCDAAIIHSETYAGLVEVGVGLIPAGGGTKEMALRITDKANSGDPILPLLGERFTNIATAKTSTSAHEGFDLGIFDSLKDKIVMNLDFQISFAKDEVLRLSKNGYTAAKQRDDIMVMGKSGLSGLYAGLAGFEIGNYASEYDIKIAKKLAWVICGGDLSMPTKVTEQYLLDLEREAFLSLLGEKKTLERIEHMLKTGKPLRN